uniref:Uncharacterized protein n=1 Tax=Triticum urartu TaxID=4572 RepID=A0A8R7P477_TRIUA
PVNPPKQQEPKPKPSPNPAACGTKKKGSEIGTVATAHRMAYGAKAGAGSLPPRRGAPSCRTARSWWGSSPTSTASAGATRTPTDQRPTTTPAGRLRVRRRDYYKSAIE